MDSKTTIVAIDDEETMLRIVKRSLEPEGYVVETFGSPGEALRRVENGPSVEIVITDLKLPEMDGFAIIEKVRAVDRDIMVIVITAFSTVESAVKAVKAGAYDFIPKPFDPEHLALVVRRAVETRDLRLENIGLRKRLAGHPAAGEIVGASRAMRQVFGMIEKVRDTDGTVLVMGESGVGKELVARAIHNKSRRAGNAFIALNCGALPDDLLESELFGYEKGAFTGAVNRKAGLFEAADNGTLFLDEVSSISPMMQVKLLRVLQERSFMRLGGKETVSVDVRIIAATNEELKEAVDRGTFRKDLYYRLNVIPIEIPPLRERRDDIPLLVRHFLSRYGEKTRKKIIGISRDAEELLLKYRWEGNVRELENIIERAITITDDEIIGIDDLPAEVKADVQPNPGEVSTYLPALSLFNVERLHIEAVLKATNNNKSKAARILEIDYSTLLRKLKAMNIAL